MKKIQKLSLNRLTKKELTIPEMNKVKGGTNQCDCGCCYDGTPGDIGYGGSSTQDNGIANCAHEWHSTVYCDSAHVWCY